MDQMFVFKNGSIISMEFATHGTLLSLIVAYKTAMVRPKRNNMYHTQMSLISLNYSLYNLKHYTRRILDDSL